MIPDVHEGMRFSKTELTSGHNHNQYVPAYHQVQKPLGKEFIIVSHFTCLILRERIVMSNILNK